VRAGGINFYLPLNLNRDKNVIPALFRHFRGVFFRSTAKTRRISEGEMVNSENEPAENQEDAADAQTNDNSRRPEEDAEAQMSMQIPQRQVQAGKGVEKLAKFVITDDPWNIHPDQWVIIGRAFEESASHFPASFGDPLRNFYTHCHELKAAEWSIVTRQAAPIFLKTLLPQEDYNGYLLLVDAILLLEKHDLAMAEIERAKNLLSQFSQYYERRFYQQQWERLRACLPTFHQLLHMHEFLKAIGPAYIYWQWPMERLCGMITQTAKSRSAANQNMANVMIQDEQMNYLSYVLPTDPNDACFTAGNEGQVNLADMLIDDHGRHQVTSNGTNARPGGYEFIAPQRTHRLSAEEQQCLRSYLEDHPNETDDDHLAAVDRNECPDTAIRWAGVQFPNFQAVSSQMKRSNSTRCNSLIRYEYTDPHALVKRSAFGRVSLFLEVCEQPQYVSEHPDGIHGPVTHHLALITMFDVSPEGRLVKVTREGGLRIISMRWIKEAIGIFLWEGEQYLLCKTTSLLL
jgi:hypothetical protein